MKMPSNLQQEPDLKIVYQIADKLKYNLDDEELREMFENLLISSMTKGKTVHPIFVDIVDKISVEDARFFKTIVECETIDFDLFDTKHDFLELPYQSFMQIITRPFGFEYFTLSEGFKLHLPKYQKVLLHINILVNLGLFEHAFNDQPIASGDLVFERNGLPALLNNWSKDPFLFEGIVARDDASEWLKNIFKPIN